MDDETDAGPLPEGFETGLADEVEAMLNATRDTDEGRQQYDDLEARVHPLAEKFVALMDQTAEFAETGLRPETRQYLYCMSQIVATRLYSPEELVRLPVNEFLHFAVMVMVGWQAARSVMRGETQLPWNGNGASEA